jgi:hypothetical protein
VGRVALSLALVSTSAFSHSGPNAGVAFFPGNAGIEREHKNAGDHMISPSHCNSILFKDEQNYHATDSSFPFDSDIVIQGLHCPVKS